MVQWPHQLPNTPSGEVDERGRSQSHDARRVLLKGEVQKLEQELWELTTNDSDIEAYTTKFSDLAIL